MIRWSLAGAAAILLALSAAAVALAVDPDAARVELELRTAGRAADRPDDEDVPWLRVGETLRWTYEVTNTGSVRLDGIEVSDDRGSQVSCPRATLGPGQRMICTAVGTVLDPDRTDLDVAWVRGTCLGVAGRRLFANRAAVSARSPSGAVVTDRDAGHYCADPDLVGIEVRKQWEGPDLRTVADGSDVRFTIAIKASGAVPLDDVVVTDARVPDCERRLGRLEAGESVVYQCDSRELRIGREPVSGCRLESEVCVRATGRGVSVSDCDPSSVELRAVEVSRTLAGRSPDGARFHVVVVNRGCDLDGVQVVDPLLPGCERDLGSLAAGGGVSFACTVDFDAEACVRAAVGAAEVRFCERTAAALALAEGDGQAAEPGIGAVPSGSGGSGGATAVGDGTGLGRRGVGREGGGERAPAESEPASGRTASADPGEASDRPGGGPAVAEAGGSRSAAGGRRAWGGASRGLIPRVLLLLGLLVVLVVVGLFYWNRTQLG